MSAVRMLQNYQLRYMSQTTAHTVMQLISPEEGDDFMPDRMPYSEEDPRHHTENLKKMLTEVIHHAREDVSKVKDPKAAALLV